MALYYSKTIWYYMVRYTPIWGVRSLFVCICLLVKHFVVLCSSLFELITRHHDYLDTSPSPVGGAGRLCWRPFFTSFCSIIGGAAASAVGFWRRQVESAVAGWGGLKVVCLLGGWGLVGLLVFSTHPPHYQYPLAVGRFSFGDSPAILIYSSLRARVGALLTTS